MERVLEAYDPEPRFRVLGKVWPRQHGPRQFFLLERASSLYELYRDLHGAAPKRATSEEVSVPRAWCAQVHE